MESYQKRALEELIELNERILKLGNFISLNRVFSTLPAVERARLQYQLAAMRTYSQILEDRVHDWEDPSA